MYYHTRTPMHVTQRGMVEIDSEGGRKLCADDIQYVWIRFVEWWLRYARLHARMMLNDVVFYAGRNPEVTRSG